MVLSDRVILGTLAISTLGAMETAAILSHTDGAYFMPIVAAVAGLGGFVAAQNEALKAISKCIKPGEGAPGGEGKA